MVAARPEGTAAFPWPRALLTSALALVVHAGALSAAFVYDDVVTVLGNRSLAPDADFWTVLLIERFRPLTNLTYVVDHALWGFRPVGFHLTGVLLHAAVTALVFALAFRWVSDGATTSRADEVATLAAVLFAVHPALTQAVVYVSARSELLCAAFALSSLLAMRRAVVEARGGFVAAAVALLLLGLASKETAALTPFLALLFVWLRFDDAQVRRRAAQWLGPIAGVLVLAGVWRAWFFLGGHATERGAWANLQLQAIAFWQYAALLVAPANQSLMHAMQPLSGPVDALAVTAAVGIVAALALGWRWRRARPEGALAAWWFALVLLPAASVVPLNEPMSEHRIYLASVGMLVAAAAAVGPWLGQRGVRIATALVCVVLAGRTLQRERLWADEKGLWLEAVERAPESWRAHYGLGEALRAAKDCAAAIPAYEQAAQLAPRPVDALLNLGICQATVGQPGAAYRAFSRALELEPKNPAALTNLATLALMNGAPATAKAYLVKAAEADPTNPERRARVDSMPDAPDTRPWPPSN